MDTLRSWLYTIGLLQRKQIAFFWALLFVISTISVFLFQRLFYRTREESVRLIQEKQAIALREVTRRQYEKLLEKVSPSPMSMNTDTDIPARALGNLHIRFVFVKPASLPDDAISGFREKLINPKHDEKYALSYIPIYILEQSGLYAVSDLTIQQSYSEIYSLPSLIKVGDMANHWNKDLFGVVKLQDQFEQVLIENNEHRDEYIIFLYFDNSFELLQSDANKERLYEYKKFRSFAKPEQKRAYVNVYSFDSSKVSTVTLVSLHELLHLFGAHDKYNENSDDPSVCTEKGRGNPRKIPIWPQETGDIMCLFVERGGHQFIRGSLDRNNLVINPYTAAEIGWTEN